ncbi:putative metal ion efflux outer membrane family protein (TolC-like) [Desulforapulum autotrophicum HRM2]|uniref:Metal ion efflux outer membrane family protein (TolC-like) n=1 Tax=Desulforapulum autotrophicum (strain ATCC 43914 / DSM 3382 / VKM B-1955 / HRM2) TaxID=177437 RepID=C0QE53_DESAH|nr:TolC family protein [Desulforapulum autotrophicum]ACN13170.1 putative metal ion efflux outer membrane family protein (TolC-like) [Desulforapulum autotrophicum HRM2]
MKKIITGLIIFCVLPLYPLYADYDGMKRDLEEYTPDQFFFTPLEDKGISGTTGAGASIAAAPEVSRIKLLEETYPEKTYQEESQELNRLLFASDLPPKAFSDISQTGNDREAAENRIKKTIVLKEIQLMAALRNPAILAAQKKITAEMQSFDQILALDDNLRLYLTFTKSVNNKTGPLKTKDAIKLTYPSPGLTALKGRVIRDEVEVLNEKMRIVRKGVITDIENAYWDLVFIENSTRIKSETIAAFDRLKDVAETLYKSGKTSFQDVIKININIEILKEDLVTLNFQKKNIEIRILELLNLPVDTRVGKAFLSTLPGETAKPELLYPVAIKYRQELNTIRHQISKLENMIEMSESMIQAPFTLGFSTFENDMVRSVGTDAPEKPFSTKTMAAMKNNSPIKPWYGVDAPWLKQTRENLSSLKETLVQEENSTLLMVREAWFNADKTRRELDLYQKQILPLSKSALDVSTGEYESGSIPFAEAIDSYNSWLNVKLAIAKKQTDLATSTALLEKIIGKKF